MRLASCITTFIIAFALVALSSADAQPGGKKSGKGSAETLDDFVSRLMAFNKAKDGKLTKNDLIDPRLHDLFDRADADKNGVVTRAELEKLYASEKLEGGGFGDKKGKDGFGGDKKGKDGFGKGKDGGFFPKGGPPQPGQILQPFQQDALKLTEDQRAKLADLQKDVDSKLDQILTAEQKTQLREMSKGFPFGDKKGFPFGDKKGPFGDKKGPPGK